MEVGDVGHIAGFCFWLPPLPSLGREPLLEADAMSVHFCHICNPHPCTHAGATKQMLVSVHSALAIG